MLDDILHIMDLDLNDFPTTELVFHQGGKPVPSTKVNMDEAKMGTFSSK